VNTANLQLEGLIMAVAAMNRLLAEKGLVTHEEIGRALSEAEAGFEDKHAGLSDSNRKGMVFPIRVLTLANRAAASGEGFDFSTYARMVGDRT
jgi:triphosphoribosyl-dephospho-CoA synthetase